MCQYFDTTFFEKKFIFSGFDQFCSIFDHYGHKKTTDIPMPVANTK